MKSFNSVSLLSDPRSISCLCSLFVTMSLICGAYFIGSAWLGKDSSRLSPGLGLLVVNTTQEFAKSDKCEVSSPADIELNNTREDKDFGRCNNKCRPVGSEALPEGIVCKTSDLEMRHLSGPVVEDNKSKHTKSLLALAVGIKQKRLASQIIEKFLADDFAVMLFHYDGNVNEWRDFEWSDRVIHISAKNQTKWWFAKRFLHPDIVAAYEYVFLWDEDLGVDNFHPASYLSIIKEEGLEISQPALDSRQSEVHHHITVRNRRSRVHRRFYRSGQAKCDDNSTSPPCVGWVEMMAPVFSRAAWRCAWYMIQNDLIHAWGLDMQLGYCAQGDRTLKVGVVDKEYIIHFGLPTLGGPSDKNKTNAELSSQKSARATSHNVDKRYAVRLRSYNEMKVFRNRWEKAVKEDECWVDPFPQPSPQK